MKYCPTNEMIADMLTKALPEKQFVKLRDMVVGRFESRGSVENDAQTANNPRITANLPLAHDKEIANQIMDDDANDGD